MAYSVNPRPLSRSELLRMYELMFMFFDGFVLSLYELRELRYLSSLNRSFLRFGCLSDDLPF